MLVSMRCSFVVASLFFAAVAPAQHTASQAAIARFEAQIARDVAEDGVGAISAAVVVGAEVQWARGFGWADVARRRPANARTIYRIGSISKSMTAVAMARLIQEGEIDLDDKVVSHFPPFAKLEGSEGRAEVITLRQLASHTAGLIREPQLQGAAAGPIETWEDKILASIEKTSFRADPGDSYSYSNIGYGILGLTISRAAQEPFMRLVEEQVFVPLGMTSSTFIIDDRLAPRLSAGYAPRRDGTVNAEQPALEHAGRGYKVPNGGVYSTVGDLCKFIAGMTGSTITEYLSSATRTEVLRNQTSEGDRSKYGLGFSLSDLGNGVTARGHGGSVSGYNAHIIFDPESKIGVAILRNYSGGSTNLGGAARSLLGELIAARN